MKPWWEFIWKDEGARDAEMAAVGAAAKTLWDKWRNRARKVTQGTLDRRTGKATMEKRKKK